MENVRVELGENSYNILIGENILSDVAEFIANKNFTNKILVVTDSNVKKICGEKFFNELERRNIFFETAVIPAGETSKNLREAEKLYTLAIERGFDRKSVIIALGGGVVGDLAGFVAATFMRGIPFIQVPTSLLAQVDSSVGGKTAVNHALGKNLIGAFYQPSAVFIDINFLKELPEREIKSGLGEIIKYGVISDADFFSYLEENAERILNRDIDALEYVIKKSCAIKAEVVSADEKESGLRKILNFGHTIAHAVEEETHYKKYRHGEAVAIGMVGAALISEELGKVDFSDVQRLENLIKKFGMVTRCEGCDVEKMYSAILRDKKTLAGKVNWVLMRGFGEVEITSDVPESVVKKIFA